MRTSIAAAAAVALTALAACDAGETPLISRDQVRLISVPRGIVLGDPVWVPGLRAVVVWRGPETSLFGIHLYTVDLDRGTFKRLPIRGDPRCRRSFQLYPRLLPDGRLAWVEECSGEMEPEEAVTLRAFDPTSQAETRLTPYFLPFRSSDFDYVAGMRFGLLNDGNGLYERLHRLTTKKVVPLRLPFARVGSFRISPDRQTVALDAVPAEETAEGHARLDLPRKFYVMRPDGRDIRALFDIDEGAWGPPVWSPDGRSLIVALQPRGRAEGLWRVDADSGDLRLVLQSDEIESAAFLPDGRTVVAVVGMRLGEGEDLENQDEGDDRGLYVIKLSRIGRT